MTAERRLPLALVCIAVALGATGCSPAEVQPDPNDPAQLQVVTGWTSGADRVALDALLDVLAKEAPGIRVIDESVSGPRDLVAKVITHRIAAGNSPDSVAVSVGSALRSRVAAGELDDLSEFMEDHSLSGVFPRGILDMVQVENRTYGIPVGIQRVNVVWWNTDVLRDADVDPVAPASTIDEWLVDLEAVRSSGVEYPLALGDGATQLQLFECVLIADLGPERYRDLWKRAEWWETAEVVVAIKHFGQLLAFTDPQTRSDSVDDVVARVVDGESAYTVLADSSLATFEKAGYAEGRFRAAPAPGTGGTFDLRADAFAVPVGAAHEESAVTWLRVIASADGQEAFASAKGAVAARVGASFVTASSYQVDAQRSLESDLIVPSMAAGIAAPPEWSERIADAVERFVRDRREMVLHNALIDAAVEGMSRQVG